MSVTYVAAYDPYHAVFRILVMMSLEDGLAVDVEAARILDFYICYPWLVGGFKAAKDVAGQIKATNAVKRKNAPSAYQVAPDPGLIFKRMRPSQLAAVSSLASKGLVDRDSLALGLLRRTPKLVPQKLSEAVSRERADKPELYTFIGSILNMPLKGVAGLKSRSGLEEFRYDTV